jgi:ribosomal 30S subunit maturation factor RimM
MNLIKIGTIINTSGTKGAMLIIDAPKGIFISADSPVFIGYSESFVDEYFLQEDFVGSLNKSKIILKNIDTIEKANQLKEKAIFKDKQELLKQNPNYLFEEDIIDCEVIEKNTNKNIGKIIEV